ncbi:hypothetical protein [Gimesia maris]|jgi:hypothetical protein|uniref:Lipoprotein n=1 Tax=Gimesia maris TaxID=122 RepID=A0ABX5YVK6_9PLAN|nr:hypothetical protein [Gimesia maris]EDL58473.1 hypothetical protein PM8797T_11966 [Gimesia maris DSM 8797]MAC56512.1 hypothetical protein [Gimesia sp.]QDT81952.1 hypothetical protein Mal35_54420 [Gimesia maris]QEG19731.1 hypothetical protein GmarT_56370 [Gimesia maris]|tara:strand:- start:7326 stop:8021 length:696 start_codon:yes stop_codon:yes gene_type:complete
MTIFSYKLSVAKQLFQTITKLALVCVLCTTLTGCNYFILIGYLIGGPPSIEPDFDAQTQKSLTGKDVTVAIVCYAPLELQYNFDGIHNDLAKYTTFRLHSHGVKVVNPDRIRAWLDENPDWDKPEEIGEAFDVTYVIHIELHKYSLYEENSSDLYRGRAEGMVTVYEMDDSGEGEKLYSKELTSFYPLRAPRATSEITFSKFKKEYLSRLSDEIGRLFYEYYNGDDFTQAI